MQAHRIWFVLFSLAGLLSTSSLRGQGAVSPLALGDRVEPFVDLFLIERMDGVTHRFHTPIEQRGLKQPPSNGYYSTVIFHKKKYRHYCRETIPGYKGPDHDGNPGEVTAYEESLDGIHWTRPKLGLFEVNGSRDNNYVLAGMAPFSHNFSPFLDTRPDCPADQRFKALAGTQSGGGLFAFVSADGIRWNKASKEPIIKTQTGVYMFDSQNVAFWSETEKQYVAYCRQFRDKLRSIVRTTSPDFVHWTPVKPVTANLPNEHLYTSQAHPYFRSPHLTLGLATRFFPDRGQSTDIVLLTSRDGTAFDRVLKEAYIRPANTRASWGNRGNYASLNVVPLMNDRADLPEEWRYSIIEDMAIMVRDRIYRLRLDGFASLHAGFEQGEIVTKPISFVGDSLVINYETSAAGQVKVEVLDDAGKPIPGFRLDQMKEVLRGNERRQQVLWQGDLKTLAGKSIRLRFVITEGDLYSLRFMKR